MAEPRRLGLTGATGVLGRRLAATLPAFGFELTTFAGDVRDRASVDRFVAQLDVVLHAAAVVPVDVVEARPDEAISVNVGGTALIAQAADAAGCRMVYMSTSHVYRSSDAPLTEESPAVPVSQYGLTKLQGEHWVARLTSDALVLRLFSYFDQRQPPSYLLPGLAERIQQAPRGARLEIRGAHCRRDLADATWVAQRAGELIAARASGPVNVCTGTGQRIGAIGPMLAAAMGRPDIQWEERQDGPPNALVGDPSRMLRLIGDVAPFDFAAALERFAEFRTSRLDHT